MRDDGRTFARLGLLGFCAVAWLLPAAEQGHAQASGDHQYTSEDIEAGSRVYTSECALCHGANGDDVDGVNLRLGQFRSSVSDDDLRGVITTGLASARMPAFDLNSDELNGVIAYTYDRVGNRLTKTSSVAA